MATLHDAATNYARAERAAKVLMGGLFMCWAPEYQEEEGAKTVEADAANQAATMYAERMHAPYDCFREITIRVRAPSGQVYEYDIDVVCEPKFQVSRGREVT